MGQSLPLGPVQHLFRQPRLADPCFAQQQQEARPPGRPAPGVLHLRPCLLSPYQRQYAGHGPRWRLFCAYQLLVGALRRLAGLHTQLPRQRRGASVVDAQGPGAVATEGAEAHQPPVASFMQRVMP